MFGIVYNIDKEENQQTLFDLELFGSKRDEYILNLQPEDHYQGPDVNDYDSEEGSVWMFGIGIKKRGRGKKIPIYIKFISPRQQTHRPIVYHFILQDLKWSFLLRISYEKSIQRWQRHKEIKDGDVYFPR